MNNPAALVSRLALRWRRKVPQIIQSEVSECGLACLAMISGYYRQQIDMTSLRRRFGLSTQGVNLKQLMSIATAMNLRCRPLRLELEELPQLKTPCILHWDLCHFVVLLRAGKRSITIQDPAMGERTLSLSTVSRHFTGVALELWPGEDFTRQKMSRTFRLRGLLKNITGFRGFLAKLLALSLLIEGINLLLPVGTQLIMDHVIIARDRPLLTLICCGLLAFILLRTFSGFCRSWVTLAANAMIDIQWHERLFSHLLRLPYTWFEKRRLGDIQSRFTSLSTIRNVLTTQLTSLVIDSVVALGVLAMMIFYGGWLVWVVVAFMVIYVAMRLLTWPHYRQIAEEQIVNEARASSHFMETLHGMATIKALSLSHLRGMQWLTLKVDAINSGIRISRFDMAFSGASTLIATLDQVAILWLGAGMVIDGHLSLGMFVAFNAYRGEFSMRVADLTNTVLKLRMLNLHIERVADIADEDAEPAGETLPTPAGGQPVALSARGLRFRYDKLSEPVFDKLDINVAAGECVALTGASGCGKTTLMKILAGLVEPERGQIMADGVDIYKAGVEGYRARIACVLQDDKLFAGSIEENIAGFDEALDRARVVECAKLSCIDEEIARMPMGYQTLLSELGSSVSGGQRQRLLIARALYRQPHILFMDQATSHLDLGNESRINAAIASLNVTRIIVAHRPSTIASADRIIEIGALIEKEKRRE